MSQDFIKILGGGVVADYQEWGATCIYLELNGVRILVDCGTRSWNQSNPLPNLRWLDDKRIDTIIFTHAHADHLGAGPVIANMHPEAEICMTYESAELAHFQLFKQMKIVENDDRSHIFNEDQYEKFGERTLIANQKQWFNVGDAEKRVSACLWPSGHIRGAVSVLIKSPQKKIVFSGDISHYSTPTVDTAPQLPDEFTEGNTVLVTGATNGNAEIPNRDDEVKRMIEAVRGVTKRDMNPGSVLFPAFSIGRAQDIAIDLVKNEVDVFLGGWAAQILESDAYGEKFWNRRIMQFEDVETLLQTPDTPKVIIATPGMMDWGASQIAASKLVKQEKNAIFFTGYQAPGTFGRKLMETGCNCAIEFREPIPEKVEVKAEIKKFVFSGHSDGPQLANWISEINPRMVFVVHAEVKAFNSLKQRIQGKQVIAAKNNDLYCF